MNWDIFISHASEDKESFIRENVFFMLPSEDYENRLLHEIRKLCTETDERYPEIEF